MRLLNQEEKDLCERILRGHGNNNYLGNIIDPQLAGVRIVASRNPKTVDFLFEVQNQPASQAEVAAMPGRVEAIRDKLFTAISLLNLLEKEGYIFLFQKVTQIANVSQFGQGAVNAPSFLSQVVDVKIVDLLLDYLDKEIYVTEEFRNFCKHDCIARDEQRFRRQIGFTQLAIGVAALALLINSGFNVKTALSDGTKIRQNQIDTLTYRLKAIENKMDSLKQIKVIYPADKSTTILNQHKQH